MSSQFIGSIPRHYDEDLGPHLFLQYADDLVTRTVRHRPRAVLELAAGTGFVSRKLRDGLRDDCDLTVTDLNEPMLDVARAKFDDDEHVTFEIVDATTIPFDDASFDAVVCQFGVMFFPDKQTAYREVHRVLKPGGRYLFNVWGTWADNPFAALAHATIEAYFPDDPPGFYRVPFGYNDVEVIRDSLSNAGFSDVSFEQVAVTSTIPSPQTFARGLVFGNPMHDEIVARNGNPADLTDALATAIRDDLGDEMPLKALVIEAEKQ